MIVIPMAGLSRRFRDAGYTRPKYELDAHGRSLFAWSVGSFARYFATTPFLFVHLDLPGTSAFLAGETHRLGIARPRMIALPHPTRGQAETVQAGLAAAGVPDATPITIFNIDTIRPGFAHPDRLDPAVTSYLECFIGEGANWSNVEAVGDTDQVARTSEKEAASSNCCTGLYHWARAGDFRLAYAAGENTPQAGELYVAPLYNHLVAAGGDVRFTVVGRDAVIFSGVPAEYTAFLQAPPPPFPS